MTVAVIAFALCGFGCAEWSASPTARGAAGEAAFLAPATVDELQTMQITTRCRENNPIIGNCGQRVPVGLYFFSAELVHAAVSVLLPRRARIWWQGLTAGGEFSIIWNNHADGITVWP